MFMKKIIAIFLSVLIISCNQQAKYVPNLVGAFSMTSQILNNGGLDSPVSRKQLKIFTDKYVMFASNTLTDSSAVYGIGTYKADHGKVIEYIFYSSGTGDHRDTFELKIDTTATGFKQVIDRITSNGRTYKLTEDYKKVSGPVTSPLDGAWKQVENIYIRANGDSSVNKTPAEFKVYEGGYFIWAITAKDSANNNASVFGYGTFNMEGNKSVESVRNSSFISGLMGRTYAIDVEFPDTDSYKQMITFANGDKSVEIYQRLK
jgi:hypothetical protein